MRAATSGGTRRARARFLRLARVLSPTARGATRARLSRLLVPALAGLATMVFAAAANAFTIHGTIENGTTGAKNVNATIVVVNPSEGMEEVTSVEARNGRFEIPNLDPGAPMYMVRAEYAGVEYNTPMQVTGQDQDVAVTVYESTGSWEGVRIVMPHLAASRFGDLLHVEQLYEITNDTTPPRAITAKGGAFQLYLPTDMDSLTNSFVSAMGVPIERDPTPTGTPGVYQIDYPIRPGVTRIGVSYTVRYASGTYTLHQKFLQDVAHITVFAVDPSMKVTTSSHTFESEEAVHGMSAYTLHGLAAGTELVLTFAGGDPNFAGIQVEGQGGGQPGGNQEVIVVPGDEEKMSIFLMITVLLVLAGVIGMAMRDRHDPLSDPKVLRSHYQLLVSRLARLDDLRAAEAIPNDAYRAAREDLMGRLGALAMHLRAHGGLHHSTHGEHDATPKTKAR